MNQEIQLKARKSQEAMDAYWEDSLLLIETKLKLMEQYYETNNRVVLFTTF